jgi:hypothetical protein
VPDSPTQGNKSRPSLLCLSNHEELLALMQGDTPEIFPFCRELAAYLLLAFSLWPNDQQRLFDAARIYSGALNYHVAQTPKNRIFRGGTERREVVRFGRLFPASDLKSFNRIFFERIGGQKSLLFCPSVNQFNSDLIDRIEDLKIVHDVIKFMIKAAKVLPSKLRSASFAYEAVSRNVFSREGGYGIKSGPKRTRSDSNSVTTSGSVREKWKQAPKTVMLSYVLTELYKFPFYDLADIGQFVTFSIYVRGITKLRLLVSSIAKQLVATKATQNESIAKWAGSVTSPPIIPPFVLFCLTEEELERVFQIDQEVHKKPLGLDAQLAVRAKRNNWLLDKTL